MINNDVNMKQIIINEKQQKTLEQHHINENINFFSFTQHIKDYLKKLLKNPAYAKPDNFLIQHGLDGERLLDLLKQRNIIIKNERIENLNSEDKFIISYNIPRENFTKKLKRLYSYLFEQNIIESTILSEDCDVIGGASSAGNSEPVTQPLFGKPIRKQKTIYITSKQANKLKEAVETTTMFGDFGYDAPPFKKKKDPAYNHNNIIKKSFKNE